jgi:hypothetical protein
MLNEQERAEGWGSPASVIVRFIPEHYEQYNKSIKFTAKCCQTTFQSLTLTLTATSNPVTMSSLPLEKPVAAPKSRSLRPSFPKMKLQLFFLR